MNKLYYSPAKPPWLLVVALVLISLAGCSAGSPNTPRVPEASEKAVFDAISSFYCSQQRWPESWSEFIEHDSMTHEQLTAVGEIVSPEISSPRAVLLVVRYKNIQGIDRKVTFIAPPECSRSDDPSIVSMAGGRVSFKRPRGFSALDGAAIKAKWKDGPYPDAAWQLVGKGIFVTVSFGEVQVEPSELHDLKEELEAAYESSVPGIEWIEKSLAADDQPPKLIHMLSSEGAAGRVASYGMSMSFDGRLLTISVAGPAPLQAEVEAVADGLRRSLRLR